MQRGACILQDLLVGDIRPLGRDRSDRILHIGTHGVLVHGTIVGVVDIEAIPVPAIALVLHVIAAHEEMAIDALGLVILTIIRPYLEDTVLDGGLRGGTRLIVVIHKVIATPFARITAVRGAPIVEYIIAEVHQLIARLVRVAATAEAGRTAVMVGH